MSIFEYDEEKELKLIRADERDQGIQQGKALLLLEILSECGDVPPVLQERIMRESNMKLLKEWVKIVVKSSTIEEFITTSGCLAD